jgi:hypothetical protein
MQQYLEVVPGYLKFIPRDDVNRVLREFIEAIIACPNGKIVGTYLH